MAPFSQSHVSPHFSRRELGYDTAPTAEAQANLERLAALLEELRLMARVPLRVTSAFRTVEHNALLPGASATSQHLNGEAADFLPMGITVQEFLRRIQPAAWGQLIFYPLGSNHVHVSLPSPGRLGSILVQGSGNPNIPNWIAPRTLADTLQVYRSLRGQAGSTALVLLVVLALGVWLFFPLR